MVEEQLVDIDLSQYKREDFKRMSWEEYGKVLDNLYKKVKAYVDKNNIKIDAVVPILRGGGFPGTYLAYRLHLLRIIPIQYKYFFKDGDLSKIKLKRLLDFPKGLKLSKNPTFLLAEQNMCFGLTATKAAEHLKERHPGCKIILAADSMDYSYQKFDIFDAIFYGVLGNDTKEISTEECKKKGIDPSLSLFPWEDLNEEHTTVQAKQFKYNDLGLV
tara:strand:+ start:108 stop:755 length:648 start_codon:yes stop_codon:yes gene_type:complete